MEVSITVTSMALQLLAMSTDIQVHLLTPLPAFQLETEAVHFNVRAAGAMEKHF